MASCCRSSMMLRRALLFSLSPSKSPFPHSSSCLFSVARRLLHGGAGAAVKNVTDHHHRSFATVHSTAVVHPGAVLGQGVSIGPFCTVGSDVKIGDACQLHPGSHIFGDTQLGHHCILHVGAIVGADIPGQTIIGNNNVIGHYAVIGVKCQDMKYKLGDECFLHIGNGNEIREYVSIHRSSKPTDKTVIGDSNLIMGSCHIAHDCKVGSNNIFANNTLLAGHVIVEDYNHTAGATAVHQFCRLGSFSFIGGGAVVSQDVPKYMMVSGDRAELRGLNLEGLRRHGFSDMEVRSMRKAYRNIFMSTANSGTIEDRLSEVERDEELNGFTTVRSMVQSIRSSFDQGDVFLRGTIISRCEYSTVCKGNTAVYLLYAHARICSIIRKSGKELEELKKVGTIIIGHPDERVLALHLIHFAEIVEEACTNLFPSVLCEYLYNLSEIFTRFYTSCQVVGSAEETSRLLICEATAVVMRTCFHLLGITPVFKI